MFIIDFLMSWDNSVYPTLMMSATLRIAVGSHEGALALDTKYIRPIAQSSTPNCPSPNSLRRRGRQFIFDDLSALHHEFDSLHLGDILQGVACHGDHVRELTLFDRTQTILLVDDFRIDRCGHAQGIDRRCAPLDEDGEHFRLHAV